MPPRDWKSRIDDILEAISRIQRYTYGMGFAALAEDDRTIDAVIRNITIIGEAARHVPDSIQGKYPNLPWAEMRGMRNVVTHEYFGVDLSILWETIQKNLPAIKPALEELLRRES